MTAKDYLSQVYYLQRKIERMELRYQEYEEMASSVSSPNYSGVRVDGTKSFEAPFVKWIEKAIDLGEDIKKKKKELDTVKTEIVCAIEKLENEDHKSVLMLRYISCISFPEIGKKLYASIPTVKRWHKYGLEKIRVQKGDTA